MIKIIPNALNNYFVTAGISNDLKYVVSSGSEFPRMLHVWDYSNNSRIKSIKFDGLIQAIQFTNDSRLLYIGTNKKLYRLQAYN